MELYLIRHGQSLNNALPERDRVEDPPLTDVGRQQCERLSTWMRSLGVTRIVSSPFLRTLQTASYLARSLRLMPEVRIDLHELGGCVSGPTPEVFVGRPGMTRQQILDSFPGFNVAPEIDGVGWWGSKPFETEDLARQRAIRLLANAVEQFAGTPCRVAYVMHADIKRLILEDIHTGPLATPFNTSISKIRLSPAGCRLEEYNRVDHLPPELLTR